MGAFGIRRTNGDGIVESLVGPARLLHFANVFFFYLLSAKIHLHDEFQKRPFGVGEVGIPLEHGTQELMAGTLLDAPFRLK